MMKGVLAGIAPGVTCIDITHAVPPQDIRSAAYLLWSALAYFPTDSVHLVVVDPGVGTQRLPIAARTPWGYLVGPDNGVFSYVWSAAPPDLVVTLENTAYQRASRSYTFHGRDIFAPAAAYLARGVPLRDFGPALADPQRLPTPRFEIAPTCVRGEVIYIDHFGNAVTSIGRLLWDGAYLHLKPAFSGGPAVSIDVSRTRVRTAGCVLGSLRRTYGAERLGEPLALVGSAGLLELAVNQGHAADVLGLRRGDWVELDWSHTEINKK